MVAEAAPPIATISWPPSKRLDTVTPPAASRTPPLPTEALRSTPPVETFTVPPALTEAPMSVPPPKTSNLPPLLTVTTLTTPFAGISRMPPDRIVPPLCMPQSSGRLSAWTPPSYYYYKARRIDRPGKGEWERTGGEGAAAPSVAGHGGLVGVELTALCRPVNVPCRSNAPATTAMRACARPNLPSARQRHDSGIVRGRLAAVWR